VAQLGRAAGSNRAGPDSSPAKACEDPLRGSRARGAQLLLPRSSPPVAAFQLAMGPIPRRMGLERISPQPRVPPQSPAFATIPWPDQMGRHQLQGTLGWTPGTPYPDRWLRVDSSGPRMVQSCGAWPYLSSARLRPRRLEESHRRRRPHVGGR